MVPIVVCIALSELNTHIIKIILSVPKCVPKKPNLHTFWHTPSLDTVLTACHHAQHWTCASIDTMRVQQHDASHVGMRCRASRTFQQMAMKADAAGNVIQSYTQVAHKLHTN